jgi:hypothetical protein
VKGEPFPRRCAVRRRRWGVATAVVAVALIVGPLPETALAAAARAVRGASESPVRTLRIYYQSPVLVRAGERVMMPVQIVCATADGTACDASLSLGIRSGVGDAWRFHRVRLGSETTFDLSAPAARAAGSPGAQSVALAFQAEAGGVVSSLPPGGVAPLKFYVAPKIRVVRVPTLPFGRVKAGRTVLTLPWGSGPRRVGLELGRESPTLGPSAFDVDRAGRVFLLDALQGRVAQFSGARLVREWAIPAEPSSDLAVAGDGTVYVTRRVGGQVRVARRTRSGRDRGTVSLGPALLSQLEAGASSAFAELLPMDAWARVPATGSPVLTAIAGRPIRSNERLLRVGNERFVRLGLVRSERVKAAVELRTSRRFGEVALAEAFGSAGYVVVVRIWRPNPASDQFQVIRVSNGRVAESFAISSRTFAASQPLSRFRMGRDGRLYQLVSGPAGIRIVQFDLKGES